MLVRVRSEKVSSGLVDCNQFCCRSVSPVHRHRERILATHVVESAS